MNKQNVTLSVPKEILGKIKVIAAKRGTSITSLITSMMEDLVNKEEGYETARRRHLAALKSGFDLGTKGRASWKRDELHDR